MNVAGGQILGVVLIFLGGFFLFAPLGLVLVAAAKSGRGRILLRAFLGSLVVAVGWLSAAWIVRVQCSAQVATWLILGGPWASALGAVIGWKNVGPAQPESGKK
jgi:hypothetical protein